MLVARAVDAFGDEIKASSWLPLPNRDLGGQTPLQVAQKNGDSLTAHLAFNYFCHGLLTPELVAGVTIHYASRIEDVLAVALLLLKARPDTHPDPPSAAEAEVAAGAVA
jgi:hypothetical protein